MNPELRKRLINSIDYLRRMDFFQDYSNLTSEEILERIFGGEIDYTTDWESEDELGRVDRRICSIPAGQTLKKSIEEKEELWMKKSDAFIDLWIACFDTKRVVEQDYETDVIKGAGVGIFRRVARISRGIFNPIILGEDLTELDRVRSVFTVHFKYRGEKHSVKIFFNFDFLNDSFVNELNELIKDTGYQYYKIGGAENFTYVVLTEDEAEKLTKERGWRLVKRF